MEPQELEPQELLQQWKELPDEAWFARKEEFKTTLLSFSFEKVFEAFNLAYKERAVEFIMEFWIPHVRDHIEKSTKQLSEEQQKRVGYSLLSHTLRLSVLDRLTFEQKKDVVGFLKPILNSLIQDKKLITIGHLKNESINFLAMGSYNFAFLYETTDNKKKVLKVPKALLINILAYESCTPDSETQEVGQEAVERKEDSVPKKFLAENDPDKPERAARLYNDLNSEAIDEGVISPAEVIQAIFLGHSLSLWSSDFIEGEELNDEKTSVVVSHYQEKKGRLLIDAIAGGNLTRVRYKKEGEGEEEEKREYTIICVDPGMALFLPTEGRRLSLGSQKLLTHSQSFQSWLRRNSRSFPKTTAVIRAHWPLQTTKR